MYESNFESETSHGKRSYDYFVLLLVHTFYFLLVLIFEACFIYIFSV